MEFTCNSHICRHANIDIAVQTNANIAVGHLLRSQNRYSKIVCKSRQQSSDSASITRRHEIPCAMKFTGKYTFVENKEAAAHIPLPTAESDIVMYLQMLAVICSP